MKRRSLLRTGLLFPAATLAGCLGSGGRAAHTWWVLDAPGAVGTAEPDAKRATLSLVVEGIAAGAFYDGTSIIYSRGPGMRAPYLYASWTERPAARLARLAQQRLQARGGFRDVTLAEAGVAPDLLLTLTLERLDHDLSENGNGNGGELYLALNATLVDWKARRPVAWHRFVAVEPVATADADAAVVAADRAASAVLDELAPWAEAAAAIPAAASSPADAAQEEPGPGPSEPASTSRRGTKRAAPGPTAASKSKLRRARPAAER